MTGKLVLENGVIMSGRSFGYEGDGKSFVSLGEIVFNTSMSGYQEILSDPSYCQQIVCMTYPLIGNYGVTDEDMESAKAQVAGFVVREYQPNYSNFRASKSLAEFLKEQKIPAIDDIDTRRLTRLIREEGALRSAVAIGDWDDTELLKLVQDSQGITGQNLAEKVSTKKTYSYPENKGKENYHV
ncbi:MAG: carbamoyl phosphate synthase small subunit, partial [Spirochaetota bacterium]|nr:carbamoyl phosphate synthase small subunit [Spirochaetota bacterium]